MPDDQIDPQSIPYDYALRNLVGYNLKRSFARVISQVHLVLAQFGLKRVTFSVLTLICDKDGISQGALGEILAIERPHLAVILDELETQKLIHRKTSKSDRRAKDVFATKKGRDLASAAMVKIQEMDHILTAEFGPGERELLISLLNRLEAVEFPEFD